MAEEAARRPSIVAKRTHIRQQKHQTLFPDSLPTPPRVIDGLIAGLGYAGIAFYTFQNYKKLNPWELASLTAGSLTFGYGLFGLGKRNGIIQGAGFALRSGQEKEARKEQGEDDWKGEFKGMEFEALNPAEKIAWLKKENARIKDLQEDEQLRCGQAYIAKEEAYAEYDKYGNYGGAAWKSYIEADSVCQDMYNKYEKQQKRLSDIRKEINELSEKI
ncbi:uncharacterized protein PAC_17054 [Phialocephala subalpina]|uniref:Uncharacterized protein n=1 Tax=Phialocephala subalpina TaxID=576137 RepID=A0A1L7XQ67_9HELO|nr:uncharacterized protein PAC_17054 [Phialocephala subalpina]